MTIKFNIWSGSHRAWWKTDGAGYTTNRTKAGIFAVEDLENQHLNSSSGNTPGDADVLVPIEETL